MIRKEHERRATAKKASGVLNKIVARVYIQGI